MRSLKTTDKKILEKLFKMEGGYVLSFSDKSMERFFKDDFGISLYDAKYDLDFSSKSKANRLRGILSVEDNIKVSEIIFALVDCAETDILTSGKEISPVEKNLIEKARNIATMIVAKDIIQGNTQPEVQQLKKKAELIKDFNATDFKSLEANKRIYLLKVLYSYYEAIIRTYYGSGLFFVSSGIDDLNDYFKVLRKRMIELIELENTFADIKKSITFEQVVEPITSLYSSMDFLDVVWEDSTHPLLVNLREEIADKDLFENGSEIHKAPISITNFLEAISQEMEKLEKFLSQKTKSFYEDDLPKQKDVFENTHNINNVHYITKSGDDFKYKGKLLPLSKKANYYKVFCALYALLPNGGEIEYKELIKEIKSRIPSTKSKSDEEMRKFIQSNLTEKSNGFMRYAKVSKTEDNSKPLIDVIKGFGINFNNKAG